MSEIPSSGLIAKIGHIGKNERNLCELIAKASTVGVVPFVGAGLSCDLDYPSWTGFLLREAKPFGLEIQVQALCDKGDFGVAADLLIEKLHLETFEAAVRAVFGREPDLDHKLAGSAVELLPRLATGLVITTNFDSVLSEVFKRAGRPFDHTVLGGQSDLLNEAIVDRLHYLLKIHGNAKDRNGRVLTSQEYDRAYGAGETVGPLARVLRHIGASHRLLFVGCDLTADRTMRILQEECRQRPHYQHFAILGAPADLGKLADRTNFLADRGICPIYYPSGAYKLVVAILAELAETVSLARPFVPTGAVDLRMQRQHELAYLQDVRERYDRWAETYTDLSATARIEEPKVKLKPAGWRIIEMRHSIYEKLDHDVVADTVTTIKTESLAELRKELRRYRRVALIGDPGAGKTTTLERLAYDYARSAAEDVAAPFLEPLPLFVSLGKYTGEDFTQFLAAEFAPLRLAEYVPHRVVLLLDGLNEMPVAHHGRLKEWLLRNSEVAAIVSCRKLDYDKLKLPLQRVDVLPLDLERIRLFIGNFLADATECDRLFWALAGLDAQRMWAWYRQQANGVTYHEFFDGVDNPGLPWEPERKRLDALRRDLRAQGRLPDMLGVVTNPFLLQIVIDLYVLSGGVPPRNKGDLFERFVSQLLKERGKPSERPDRPWIVEEEQKRALSALAYRMQRDRTGTSVSADFVRETFRAVSSADADLLLYFAEASNTLEHTEAVRFSHQLLQEYFAAYGMGEDLRRGVPATAYFPSEDWWTPTGWEETALLLAGMQGDATTVAAWLMPVHPDLAYRVATESGATCAQTVLQALYEPAVTARRSPYAVAEWGRLNHHHDCRPGVGLRPDGLPDLAWCPVPAGRFIVGADDQRDNPRREEEIRYAFKIAKYPVTSGQFQAFLDSGEYDDPRWWDRMPGKYKRPPLRAQNNPYRNHPRDNLSWYQAVAFSRWLDQKYRAAGLIAAGEQLRLPLETEWEYAARGHDGRAYPWGDSYRVGHANLDEQEEGAGPYFLNRTTAVGLYPAGESPFGVLDLAGTIWEWCMNDFRNPHVFDGYSNHLAKVLRGGAFNVSQYDATASSRGNYIPIDDSSRYGVRLVIAAPIVSLTSRHSDL